MVALCRGSPEAPAYVLALSRPEAPSEVVFLAAPAFGTGYVVMPGSFNPMHEGHEVLASKVVELRKERGEPPASGVLFESCPFHPDKGVVPIDELRCRAEAIVRRGHRLLLTRASLYKDKAVLCPRCDFGVGYDVYEKIVNPKYYVPAGKTMVDATDAERRAWVIQALDELHGHGIRFFVAGRANDDGTFLDLDTAPCFDLPEHLAALFVPVPGFRLDISSTELRRQAVAAAAATAGSGASALH